MRSLLAVLLMLVACHQVNAAEKTVVFRVVATSPKWGQEARPGWATVSAVKDAPGYKLYDVEIGRDASGRPAYVAVRKFGNDFAKANLARGADDMVIHALVAREDIADPSPAGSSRGVREALEKAFANIIQQERPTRLVINYAGHGSRTSLFENTINGDDAEKFLSAVKHDIGSGVVILDLSTNCQVGYFEFVSRYAKHVDYILASEKNFGGFDISQSDMEWTSDLHDYIYDQFWQPGNSTSRAFDEIIAARRRFWQREADGIRKAGHDKEQSVTIYDAKQLQPLVTALHQIHVADLETIPLQHSSDIGTFIYDRKDPKLIRLFERFRIRYASSRDVVDWDDDSRGLSIASAQSLITAP